MAVGGCILLTLFGWAHSVIYYRSTKAPFQSRWWPWLRRIWCMSAFCLFHSCFVFPSGRVPSRPMGLGDVGIPDLAGTGIITNMVVGAIHGNRTPRQHATRVSPVVSPSDWLRCNPCPCQTAQTNSVSSYLFSTLLHRSSGGELSAYRRRQPQQLKWLAGGAFMTLVGLLVDNAAPSGGYSGPAVIW